MRSDGSIDKEALQRILWTTSMATQEYTEKRSGEKFRTVVEEVRDRQSWIDASGSDKA